MNPENESVEHQVGVQHTAAAVERQAAQTLQAMTATAMASPSTAGPTRAAARQAGQLRTRTTRRSNGAAATPATPGDPAVSITLPKELYDYFKQQADADERTLAAYLKRVLRAMWQREHHSELQAGPSNQVSG
jgi:hypothetical protein